MLLYLNKYTESGNYDPWTLVWTIKKKVRYPRRNSKFVATN